MFNTKSERKNFLRFIKIFTLPFLALISIGIFLFQLGGKYTFDPSTVVNDNGILYLNTGQNVAFVGGKKCYACHKNLSHSFRHSEMARSFEKLTKDNIVENYPQSKPVYDEASNFYYTMFEENEKFYQEEYRLDNDGNVLYNRIMEAQYTIGSGNNLRMYFNNINGRFYQLPLTWNTFKKTWVMSPGFSEHGNLRFLRFATDKCLHCHNSYLIRDLKSIDEFEEPYSIGIDCERCHGPGELHIKQINKTLGRIPKNARTIVNPSKLSVDRHLSICMQCHLEGKAWVLQTDKDYNDFRPGQLLSKNRSVYYPKVTVKGVIEVGDSPQRLMLSKCFTESNGKLACFSCHNVHKSIKSFSIPYYNDKCINCHKPAKLSKIASLNHDETMNCVSCHMNRTGTENTLHGVSLTDHWIRKYADKTKIDWSVIRHPEKQPPVELIAYVDENDVNTLTRKGIAYLEYYKEYDDRNQYLDSAILYIEKGLAVNKDTRAYYSLGEIYYELGNQNRALSNLLYAIKIDTNYYKAHYLLGKIYKLKKQLNLAIKSFSKAVELKPGYAPYLEILGTTLVENKQYKDAEDILTNSINIDGQNPYAFFTLGNIYAITYNNPQEALSYYKTALHLDPDIEDGYLNIGNTYAMMNNFEEAIISYNRQLSGNPNSVSAYINLSLLYKSIGEIELASETIKRGIELNPHSVLLKERLNQHNEN